MEIDKPEGPLRTGWTTGACAAAAAKAAFIALHTGRFPDPVSIILPRGETPSFALALERLEPESAEAGIVKDAGDDPDVTHGALVKAEIRHAPPGAELVFRAGPGVGLVTKPGLPVPPGEPAINPGPRAMIRAAIAEAAASLGVAASAIVTLSIPGGETIAKKTLNPRLGIVGGLSILGTTGIVVPYSCSAWIHSIHRGIDVARAAGLVHIAGSTGSTSEAAIARLDGLDETALIDMGDFVGGMLKYLREHPVARVTIAGGFAKLSKLAQGRLDLHSRAGPVDFDFLALRIGALGGEPGLVERARLANTAQEVLGLADAAGLPLAASIVEAAADTALRTLRGADIALDVAMVDRDGRLVARTAPRRPAAV